MAIISHKLKLIFIEVPKTGSTSFRESLKEVDTKYEELPRHIKARDLKPLIDANVWDKYNKIGFVRFPEDWITSVKGMGNHFMRRLGENTPYDWFTDEKGNLIIDSIYRTEDLNEIFTANNMPIKELNIAVRRTDDYRVGPTFDVSKLDYTRENKHYDNKSSRILTLNVRSDTA